MLMPCKHSVRLSSTQALLEQLNQSMLDGLDEIQLQTSQGFQQSSEARTLLAATIESVEESVSSNADYMYKLNSRQSATESQVFQSYLRLGKIESVQDEQRVNVSQVEGKLMSEITSEIVQLSHQVSLNYSQLDDFARENRKGAGILRHDLARQENETLASALRSASLGEMCPLCARKTFSCIRN